MDGLRRQGVGLARRAGFRGAADAPGALAVGTPLLDWADGTFGRAEEGSYYEADNTVAWFAADVPRIGARGVLIERESVSWLNRPVYLDASWTALNGTPVSSIVAGSLSGGGAPDGTTAAQVGLGNTTTSQITQQVGNGVIPDNTIVALSAFIKGDVGGEQVKLRIANKAAVNTDVDTTLTNAWALYENVLAAGVGTGAAVNIRLMNRTTSAMNLDAFAFYMNTGRYPLTARRATTQGPTWQPDLLSFLSAQVPLHLREGRVLMPFTPLWAPSDIQSGEELWLGCFGTGATDGWRVRHNGTDLRAEALVGGSVVAQSPAITGSTRRVRRVPIFDPPAGLVYMDGVAGPAGTPWAMPGGVQFRAGGILGAANEINGYIERPTVA